MSAEFQINPKVLRWARESSGIELDVVAKRLRLRLDQVSSWESGEAQPTVAQLFRLASLYKRPTAALLLTAPPPDVGIRAEFRRMPAALDKKVSASLRLEIRRARYRRNVVVELLTALNRKPLAFSPSINARADSLQVGVQLRKLLRPNIRRGMDDYAVLSHWKARIEQQNVLVFQSGVRAVSEFRALSIFEPTLPIILLNSQDSARARVFSLLHEFAHLIRGAGSFCGSEAMAGISGNREESFCNSAAAETLVPQEDLLQRAGTEFEDVLTVKELSEQYKVSQDVVLTKLYQSGKISRDFYDERRSVLAAAYKKLSSKTSPKIPPFRKALSRAGTVFASLVLEAADKERITLSDASDYLELKLRHFDAVRHSIDSAESEK